MPVLRRKRQTPDELSLSYSSSQTCAEHMCGEILHLCAGLLRLLFSSKSGESSEGKITLKCNEIL